MATEQFANDASSTLSAAIGASDTAIVVASASAFPTLGQFRVRVESEVMLVTGVSGATFTVTRGAEGTAAAAHAAGVAVAHVLTAGALTQLKLDAIGNPTRYPIDANTLHTYACADTVGATLVDTGSATQVAATLLGTPDVSYHLGSAKLFTHGTKSLRLLSDTLARGAQVTVTGMGTGAYTMEACCILDEYQTAGTNVNVILSLDDTTSNNEFDLGVLNNGTVFAGYHIAGVDHNTAISTYSVTAKTVPLRVPLHLMVVYDPATTPTLKVYMNGVVAVDNNQGNTNLASMTRITIGNRGGLDSGWRGWVGEVRISNVARSAAYALAAAENSYFL